MENASELEAPRMSIQTKDLIRYNNHTTYYNKNHSKFIQKSQQHSTANHLTSHYQPTAKRLGPLPSDNRKLSLFSQLSSAALIAHPSPGRSHSTQHLHPNSRAAILPGRLEKAVHASRASVFQQKKNSNEPQIHHCSSLIS